MDWLPSRLWAKILVVGAYAVMGYFLIKIFGAFLPALAPFIVSWLIASVLQKPISYFSEKFRIARKLTAVIVTVVFLSALGAAVFFAVRRSILELGELVGAMSDKKDKIGEFIGKAVSELSKLLPRPDSGYSGVDTTLGATVTDSVNSIIKSVYSFIVRLLTETVSAVPEILLFTVESIIAAVYFAIDYNRVKAFISKLLPSKIRFRVFSVKNTAKEITLDYLKASLIMMLITFITVSVGLTVIGIRYALLLSALIAFVDFLPVLGVGTILAPWGVVQIISGDSVKGLYLLGLWGIVEAIRSFTEPHLLSKSIGLHPIATLISIYCGYRFFGIPGMILCPIAVTVCVKYVETDVIKKS